MIKKCHISKNTNFFTAHPLIKKSKNGPFTPQMNGVELPSHEQTEEVFRRCSLTVSLLLCHTQNYLRAGVVLNAICYGGVGVAVVPRAYRVDVCHGYKGFKIHFNSQPYLFKEISLSSYELGF